MSKLAIKGGKKTRSEKFPPYNPVGDEEEKAVQRVFKSKVFSKFLGCWHNDFYGGEEIRALEEEWSQYFGVKHTIAVNSATAGLYCAAGALGVGPGDEVIVSPYTMSASATAPLIFNAVPVFADIEEAYFCLSPQSVEDRITPRTKAIIVVDIFGQPYDVSAINQIARRNNLTVIEDAAQAPGAIYERKQAGTLGDIGVYSLNYHKHIHTGEGGIVVTDSDELAERIRLIRNHAEAVVEAKGVINIVNMLGFNFRMTEIEAAMAREQLKKLEGLVASRIRNVEYLNRGLSSLGCIEVPPVRPSCRHSFYLHVLKYRKDVSPVSRDIFVKAVKAELPFTERREGEGVKVGTGYVKPLYLQPLYQQKIAYGKLGCPWSCEKYRGKIKYDRGICPSTEKMYYDTLITHELMHSGMDKSDLDDVIMAFRKVWDNIEELI